MQYSEEMSNDLRCISCNKRLMKVLITDPNIEKITRIKATCPFCDSESEVITVKGIFYTGPIPEKDEFDESNTPTKISEIEYSNDIFKFEIRKG